MSDDGCGCGRRRARLNRVYPGLGDAVARIAEPVYRWYLTVVLAVAVLLPKRRRRVE